MRQESDERIRMAPNKNEWEHKLEEAFVGDKGYYRKEGERR